jgi:predicted N-acetyltransferase YhbS
VVRYERVDQLGPESAGEVWQLYQSAWWATARDVESVERVLAGSDLTLGFRDTESGELVAFSRVLTDFVYKAFLFDVIVAPAHRGAGLGKALADAICGHPSLAGVQNIELYCLEELVPFYEQWGFSRETGGMVLMRRSQALGVEP